jgi:DinB superfamily
LTVDLKEFFLKQKEAAHQSSMKVFGMIPPASIDWRPADGMLTLGEIVRHVGMSEDGTRRAALFSDWSYYEKRVPLGLSGILGVVTALDEELDFLEGAHQTTLQEVAAYPLSHWEEERVNDAFHIRRKVAVMLFGINEHHAHHRAQVGTYLHILTGARASHYAL